MALTKCNECGEQISTKATACPKCGAPQKKKTSLLTWLGVVFVGLAVLGAMTGKQTLSNSSSPPAATSTPKPSTETKSEHSNVLPSPEKQVAEKYIVSLSGQCSSQQMGGDKNIKSLGEWGGEKTLFLTASEWQRITPEIKEELASALNDYVEGPWAIIVSDKPPKAGGVCYVDRTVMHAPIHSVPDNRDSQARDDYKSLLANIWVGTKLYLASTKDYVGEIAVIESNHRFPDGTTRDAILVNNPGGSTVWVPRETAKMIYVTK